MIIGIITALLLGILLSGVWFIASIFLDSILSKYKITFLSRFKTAITALIPTFIILWLNDNYWLNIDKLFEWQPWIVLLITILLTVFIVSQNKTEEQLDGKQLLLYGLDGILMEIPQRLMMQSFVWYILKIFDINNAIYISILLTAIVWCISIVIQNLLSKAKIDRRVLIDLLASFVFSIGAGYALVYSGFIGFTMLAHFLERVLSKVIK